MRNKVINILWMLVAQFFLGMALNLIGEPASSTPAALKISAYVLLIAHILNAFGLLITAAQLWRGDWGEDDRSKLINRQGLLSLVIAAAAGALTVSAPLSELWSFVMAAGFMLALLSFGRLYARLK